MRLIDSEDIFENTKLQGLAKELVESNSNILIFGLPHSGKSTLVKAVCKADSRFITLKHEEIISCDDNTKIVGDSPNFWCVGHQYPNQKQDVSDDYLTEFAENMKLNSDKWNIIRIRQ